MAHEWILALQGQQVHAGLSSLGLRKRALAMLGQGPVDWGIRAGRLMAEHILRTVPEWPGSRSEIEIESLQRATEASTLDTLVSLYSGDLSLMCDSLEPVENVAFFVQNNIPLSEVMRNVHAGEEFVTHSLIAEIERHTEASFHVSSIKAMMNDVVTAWSLFARHVSLTYEHEADRWLQSKDSLRLQIIDEIIDGHSLPRAGAEASLGYSPTQPHLGVSLTLPTMPLESARAFDFTAIARTIARLCQSPTRPLIARRGISRCDVWIGTPRVVSPGSVLEQAGWPAELSVSIGRIHPGPAGFRLSHLEARAAARMSQFSVGTEQVTDYDDVELVSLLSLDLERAKGFVIHTLGSLAENDPRAEELRETLATYIDMGGVIAETALQLFVHRNTITYRLQQIEKVLGKTYNLTSTRMAIELVRRVPLLMKSVPGT